MKERTMTRRQMLDYSRRFLIGATGTAGLAACGVTPEASPTNISAASPTTAPEATAAGLPTNAPLATAAPEATEGATSAPVEATATAHIAPAEAPTAHPEAIVATPDRIEFTMPNTAIEQKQAADQLEGSYARWKKGFLKPIDTDGNIDVVAHGTYEPVEKHRLSEGRGYGMMIAAFMGDRDTVEKLIKTDRAVENANGLSPWDIDPQNKVVDSTAASDGDEDMAFGAILADMLWGKETDLFRVYAKDKAQAILHKLVEPDTNILRPGDTWGGSQDKANAVNPSYIRPLAYRMFARYADSPADKARWNEVRKVNSELMRQIADPTTGLVPDWTSTHGGPVTDYQGQGHDAAWDAARYAMFVAADAIVSGDALEIAQLEKMNKTYKSDGASEGSGRKLDGTVIDPTPNAVFIAPTAVAAMIDPDMNYRQAALEAMIKSENKTYYEDSIRLIGLGIVSGKFFDPLKNASNN